MKELFYKIYSFRILLAFLVTTIAVSAVSTYFYYQLKNVRQDFFELNKKQDEFDKTYLTVLYEEHLRTSERIRLSGELDKLSLKMEELLEKQDNKEFTEIQKIYAQYKKFADTVLRNSNAKLATADYEKKVAVWGELLLKKEFTKITDEVTASLTALDKQYKDYLATLPPPATSVGSGYNYVTVDTEKGKFGVYLIKTALSSVKVVTASANGDDCSDNCPTKSLAQHVQDNGGFAGMNSAYFCPPDYASCSGKVNSSDYAFYKSSSGKWLNEDALSWGDTGLATFNGSSAKFYKKSSDYDGDGVTAGVSNYPSLLKDGNVAIDSGKLTSYQKDVKGLRGAIGVGKSNLYLAIISNATVVDAAYVMKSLGAQDALNLDGGGSSAMYINGSYVVGPGRSLPNAIILKK